MLSLPPQDTRHWLWLCGSLNSGTGPSQAGCPFTLSAIDCKKWATAWCHPDCWPLGWAGWGIHLICCWACIIASIRLLYTSVLLACGLWYMRKPCLGVSQCRLLPLGEGGSLLCTDGPRLASCLGRWGFIHFRLLAACGSLFVLYPNGVRHIGVGSMMPSLVSGVSPWIRPPDG